MNTELLQIEQGLSVQLQAALRRNSAEDFVKVAQDTSEILQTGAYMYGAFRQIYGLLNGTGKVDILTGTDTNKVILVPEDKRFKIRLEVAPDMATIVKDALPKKLSGTSYLATFDGRNVEGYLSHFESERAIEATIMVESNPYDFVQKMTESRNLGILSAEDRYWFNGLYQLTAEVESDDIGRSIVAMTKAVYQNAPHKAILALTEKHGEAARLNQPFDLIVLPEARYLDFAGIADSEVAGLSKDFLTNGFGTTTDTLPLYQKKRLMLKDTRGITFSLNEKECMFSADEVALVSGDPTDTSWAKKYLLLRIFGYNCNNGSDVAPTTGAHLYANILANYGVNLANVSKFTRTMIYSPVNYVGRAYNWMRDIQSTIKNEGGFVSCTSDEWITLMLHNKYAVTNLDVWE